MTNFIIIISSSSSIIIFLYIIINYLQTRPPSQAIWISRCLWFELMDTNSLIKPARRTLRNIATRRETSSVIPRMLPIRTSNRELSK